MSSSAQPYDPRRRHLRPEFGIVVDHAHDHLARRLVRRLQPHPDQHADSDRGGYSSRSPFWPNQFNAATLWIVRPMCVSNQSATRCVSAAVDDPPSGDGALTSRRPS
jgi:hypothetical protein